MLNINSMVGFKTNHGWFRPCPRRAIRALAFVHPPCFARAFPPGPWGPFAVAMPLPVQNPMSMLQMMTLMAAQMQPPAAAEDAAGAEDPDSEDAGSDARRKALSLISYTEWVDTDIYISRKKLVG